MTRAIQRAALSILTVLALLCAPIGNSIHGANAAIALVTQAKVASGSGGTTGAADTSTSTIIILSAAYQKAGAITISDNKSNTWNPLTVHGDGTNMDTKLFYCSPCTVGSGHTFTIGGGGLNQSLVMAAFSGTAASSPFDKENGFGTGSSVSSIQPGSSGTPTVPSSLVVTGLGDNWTASVTINSSFSTSAALQTPFVGGTNYGSAIGWKESSTAENPTWTATSGSGIATAANIAVFKPSASSGAGNMILMGVGP